MNLEIQKAGIVKRISAGVFDFILIVTLTMLLAMILSSILGYNDYYQRYSDKYQEYAARFDIDLEADVSEMTDEEYEEYEAKVNLANEALWEDEDALKIIYQLTSMTLIILTVSVVLSYVALELVVPLLLGNGQTIGKKAFSLAVMRIDGVKANTFMMVTRSMLGKCAIEALVPVLSLVLWALLGSTFGILFSGLILLVQVILLIFNRNRCLLHDMLACTVVVDMPTQRIFDSAEDRAEYVKRVAAEAAEKAEY